MSGREPECVKQWQREPVVATVGVTESHRESVRARGGHRESQIEPEGARERQ